MKKSKLNVVFFLLIFLSIGAFSRNFEGVLTYIKESGKDTTYVYWYIKNNKVRIEEYNRFKDIQSTILVDINKESAFLISAEQKLYTPYEQKNSSFGNMDNFKIIKSDNFKVINGIKCYQWRVRNISKNTEISYWVARDSFMFFDKLVLHLDKTDNSISFFTSIPDYKGFFPVMSEERTLVRDAKSKVSLVSIKEKMVNNNLFVIPSDYKLLVL